MKKKSPIFPYVTKKAMNLLAKVKANEAAGKSIKEGVKHVTKSVRSPKSVNEMIKPLENPRKIAGSGTLKHPRKETVKQRQQREIDDSYRKRGGSKLPKAQIGKSTKTPKQYLDSVSKANPVKPGKSISRPRYPIPGTSKKYNDAQRDSVIKSWFNKNK